MLVLEALSGKKKYSLAILWQVAKAQKVMKLQSFEYKPIFKMACSHKYSQIQLVLSLG